MFDELSHVNLTGRSKLIVLIIGAFGFSWLIVPVCPALTCSTSIGRTTYAFCAAPVSSIRVVPENVSSPRWNGPPPYLKLTLSKVQCTQSNPSNSSSLPVYTKPSCIGTSFNEATRGADPSTMETTFSPGLITSLPDAAVCDGGDGLGVGR